jgi:Lipopolysaccharide-assembly
LAEEKMAETGGKFALKNGAKNYNLGVTMSSLNSTLRYINRYSMAIFGPIFGPIRNLTRGFGAAFCGLLVLCGLSGCAYHMGHGDRQIPGGYRTVAVPVFKNNTIESGVEVYFTNAFIREMQRSQIGMLTEKANAQVAVEGVVESVTYIPMVTVKSDNTNTLPPGTVLNTSYAILVTTSVTLRRLSDQKVLWQGSFQKKRSYQTPKIFREDYNASNALYNHSAQYQNIELLAADMMTEAHDRLTENF